MSSKTFTSSDEWYSLSLPVDWEEYDDDCDEGTHAFFNTKEWTGNLRITTLHWDNRAGVDKAAELIAQEVEENEGATMIKVGEFDCAHYKEETEDNGEEMVMYYWTFGKNNSLFICSFTTDKKLLLDNSVKAEVDNILRSIRIN